MAIVNLVNGLAAVGSAVAGAVYVNFSARVMPRLATLPPAEAIQTMQQFNVEAVKLPFMTVFFGTAALSLTAVVIAVRSSSPGPPSWLAITGGALYLAGVALTIAYHVPRNEALASVSPAAAEAVPVWTTYLTEWTCANTVRAALSLAGAAALAASAVLNR